MFQIIKTTNQINQVDVEVHSVKSKENVIFKGNLSRIFDVPLNICLETDRFSTSWEGNEKGMKPVGHLTRTRTWWTGRRQGPG